MPGSDVTASERTIIDAVEKPEMVKIHPPAGLNVYLSLCTQALLDLCRNS
jgi:hypothetical protein